MTPPDDAIALRATAARWTVRRDRGLSAQEAIEFELWLAADERHAAALRRASEAWQRLDRITDNVAGPVLAEARRQRCRRRTAWLTFGVAAAALVVAFLHLAGGSPAAVPRRFALADGTIVHLNAGAELRERFSPAERRVALLRGEAHFSVTRDTARPFVVQAGGVAVRAVGTAFNVHLQSAAVEVLVTEGTVRVDRAAAAVAVARLPLLGAGQRAVVALAPESPAAAAIVTRPSPEEIAQALAWQEPLLRLQGSTLAEVAAELERRTGRRIVLGDPTLGSLRVGGRLRGDDPDGFARVVAATLDLEVESAADGMIVLRKKTSSPR